MNDDNGDGVLLKYLALSAQALCEQVALALDARGSARQQGARFFHWRLHMRAEVSAHGKHIVIEGRASEFAEFIGLLIDREQAGEGSETSKAVAVTSVEFCHQRSAR